MVFCGKLSLVPIMYFLVVTIWLLLNNSKIGKLRSLRAPPEIPQIEESFSGSDFPHRLVNPSDYSSPLISAARKYAKYGAVACAVVPEP